MSSGVYLPSKTNPPSQLTSNALLLTENGLFYNLRVTRSLPIAITGYDSATGVFTTINNHCLTVGDAIHLDLGCGGALCPSGGNTPICLQVNSVPSDNQFTIVDNNGDAVNFTNVGTDYTNVWVALAADLTGFEVDISLYLGDNRTDKLLGLSAIPANTSQIQIQGDYQSDIKIGDNITVGNFTGEVRAVSTVSIKGNCYTIVHTNSINTSAIPFTDNNLAFLDATPVVISGLPTNINNVNTDSCGWISGSLSATEVAKVNRYISKSNSCPTLIGRWSINLVWGRQNFPNHVENSINSPQWSSLLASGLLFT